MLGYGKKSHEKAKAKLIAEVKDLPVGTTKVETLRFADMQARSNAIVEGYVEAGFEVVSQSQGASKYQTLITFRKSR